MKRATKRRQLKRKKIQQFIIALLAIGVVFELSKHLRIKVDLEIYQRNILIELNGSEYA